MKVFVYGTLKPGEPFFQVFLGARVLTWQPAKTRGCLFHLPLGYPALVVDRAADLIQGEGWVAGSLLEFAPTDGSAVLSALDVFEEYEATRSPAENQYERQLRAVFAPTGESLGVAWMYVMQRDRVQQLEGIPIPSGVWSHQHWPSITPLPEDVMTTAAETYRQNFLE